MRAHYISGILEVSSGADMQRTVFHFEQFLAILKLFSIHKLKADVPDIKDMQDNAADYIQ